jgi:hypothetical protein
MLLVSSNDAALLEAVKQSLDRTADDGDSALAVVPAARDHEHFRCGIRARVLNLLLPEPGFGSRDRFRRRW